MAEMEEKDMAAYKVGQQSPRVGSHLNRYVYKAMVMIICSVLMLFLLECIHMTRSTQCYPLQGVYIPSYHMKQNMDTKVLFHKELKDKEGTEVNKHRSTTYKIEENSAGTLNDENNDIDEDFVELFEGSIKDTIDEVVTHTETQDERQQQLREFCKSKMLRKPRMKTEMRLSNMAYSDKYGVLYCIVPKVACTNWKRVMLVLQGHIDEPLAVTSKEKVHTISYSNFKTLTNGTEMTWRKNLYYSFMFVRHPFERLLSAYRNKFVDPYNPSFQNVLGPKILQMFRPNLTEDEYHDGRIITFKEFLDYVIAMHTKSGTLALNEHWQVMHSLCSPCTMKYNFIGKMDTLAEDANTVLKEAGIDNIVQFPVNETDKYQTRTKEIMKEFFSKISKETMDKLYDIYENDFLAFGYKMPDYL